MNYFNKDDFKNEWLGKSSNLGNNYNQCVTLYKEFLKKAGYPNPGRAIGGSGGAREIWYRRIALGYDQYFNFEQVGHPGDWFIWDSVYGWYKGVYYGHVAMLIKDNGNGTGQFLGMNQAYSEAPASIQTLTYNGSCGVLHYKGYSGPTINPGVTVYNASNLVAEHALATLTVDSVAIREGSPTGKVLKRVNTGYQFEYYYKVVANGHRWVVNKDKTQFMAISNSEIQGKELWATFSEIKEETKPVEKPVEKVDYTKNVKGHGIDLSEHNSSVDLSGVDFAIIRANWWTTKDKKFDEFSKMLEEKGIPYGVYCYDYCDNEQTALEQAKYTHELIKDKNIQLGVWMDMEDSSVKLGEPGWKEKNGLLTKEHCSMVCKVFCDYFKEQGYYTGVYTSSSWINSLVSTDYPLWIANYGSNDGTIQSDQSDKAVIYQYTSKPIDKDVIYHDIDFYKSNPKKEEENKKDDPKEDDLDNLNVTGINKLIEMLLKIVEKVLNLFK